MLSDSGVTAATNIGWGPDKSAPSMINGVVILMAQKVSRLVKRNDIWADYSSEDIMIIDEAHHAAAEGYSKAMQLWRGPVIGLTATPWRLSKKEGFDHLFEQLLRGPQIQELQNSGYLCKVGVMTPGEDGRISGGVVEQTGDYSEAGIESANANSDIWTAGAVEFWRKHGAYREWSLKPRGDEEPPLGAPTQWCPHCEHMSMFGSHNCQNCEEPFGEECGRCAKWRVWVEWSMRDRCGEDHDPVCDRCHYDAHVQAKLPVTAEMLQLLHHELDVDPSSESNPLTASVPMPTETRQQSQHESDEILDPERAPFLRDLLEEERGRVVGAEPERIQQLRQLVGMRELLLADDSQMWQQWGDHLAKTGVKQDSLSYAERSRRFTEWEAALIKEKEWWEQEVAAFESAPVDRDRIYSSAVDRVLKLLGAEARAVALLPDELDQSVGVWNRSPKPSSLRSAEAETDDPNMRNKGYRLPETGKTWKLEDAFFFVATDDERRLDERNQAIPDTNRKKNRMYQHRRKVVLAAGFVPN